MGIIIRQSLRGTIYSYIGVVLGFITTGLLLPRIFSTDEVGLLKILVAYSVLFSSFGILGFNGVTYRLFPYFRNKENKHNGFLFLAVTAGIIGFIVTLLIFFAVKPLLIKDSIEKSALFVEYINYLIPLIFFPIFFGLFDVYYASLYNSTIGTFLKDIVQRILIIGSILLFFFGIIEFKSFVIAYIISYCLPTILIIIPLFINGDFNLKPQLFFIDKDLRKSIINVGLFSILTTFTGVVILNVDSIMVNSMIDLKAVGIYGITFYFGQLIKIPSKSIIKISNVVLADSWKNDDITNIKDVYFRSCLNQLILGSLLFIGLWGNIDNIFNILPPEYAAGKWVIFFIGLGNLIDMSTGVSRSIIGTSKYYKYQTVFMLVLMAMVVSTNILLIPKYGITGAAIASLISLTVFNLTRYIFIIVKFKMQPYTYKHFIVIIIAASSYYVSTLIPVFESFVIDIIIRSFAIIILFLPLLILLKVSEDINSKVKELLLMVKTKK